MNAPAFSPDAALASARRTLQIERAALDDLAARLDARFAQATALLLEARGRVVVTGIGKSGHVARKIAATLASTGTPAFFVHAAEAVHGDLGMITAQDVVIALSQSGTTQELLTILPIAQRMGARVIGMTGTATSPLAELADVFLDTGVAQEACPLNLAPTASTTVALALGDALAVACLEARGFRAEDFARSHPGGALGRRLLTQVRDVMRHGSQLPLVQPDTSVLDAMQEMTRKQMGMAIVVTPTHEVLGIFTDGDLRRLAAQAETLRGLAVRDGMTPHPRSIEPGALAAQAAAHMEAYRVSQLLVLDAGQLVGALTMHDLMAAKVV